MQQTTNYALKKIELTDSPPDITAINPNWDTIDKELKDNADSVAAHLAEDMIHLAGGTANAITITTGADYSYGQFKQLHFKASANNTGNVTINVDGNGTVPALKFDGTQLAAGAIKANKVYDFYYDTASGGRFFLIAKASGNAVVGDVLAGKFFSNDDGELIGTMPNRGGVGAQILNAPNQSYTIPRGFHDGTAYVLAAYERKGRSASGTIKTSGQQVVNKYGSNVYSPVVVTGLPFKPTRWRVWENGAFAPNSWMYYSEEGKRYQPSPTLFPIVIGVTAQGGGTAVNTYADASVSHWFYSTSDGLFCYMASGGGTYHWEAFEY